MLSIGRFADATGLTVKALRHYDEIGLLAPAHVDRGSRYRYYDAAQIEDAVTIRRLRALELSLDEIKELLHAETDALRDRLAAHGYRVAEEVRDKHSLLIELGALVEGGGEQVVVEVRGVPELQLAATIRHLLLIDPEGVAEMLRLAWSRLAEDGISPVGPATARFWPRTDTQPSTSPTSRNLGCRSRSRTSRWSTSRKRSAGFANNPMSTRTGSSPSAPRAAAKRPNSWASTTPTLCTPSSRTSPQRRPVRIPRLQPTSLDAARPTAPVHARVQHAEPDGQSRSRHPGRARPRPDLPHLCRQRRSLGLMCVRATEIAREWVWPRLLAFLDTFARARH